ncbi:Hypothetical predicted protein, partial [Olea europaea subsp. europaea]
HFSDLMAGVSLGILSLSNIVNLALIGSAFYIPYRMMELKRLADQSGSKSSAKKNYTNYVKKWANFQ